MTLRPKSSLLAPAPARVERGTARPRVSPRLAAGLEQDAFGGLLQRGGEASDEDGSVFAPTEGGGNKAPATESIGRRAGALSDELDFTEFVASLVHGTFDALVDASIRQMESFADLVAAVSKPVEQFTDENVSLNQARDWLVERFPRDLGLVRDEQGALVVPLAADGEEQTSPEWLADFGLEGEALTAELVEGELLPLARRRVAQDRLQTLATMVLLGMNRVVVKEGTIAARLRFRATASDKASVDYAVSDDPATTSAPSGWGRRGSRTYAAPTTRVSTLGVNAQSDSNLNAELFGEVRINFASETVPLDRFVDEARRVLLERHAKQPRAVAASRTPALAPEAVLQPAAITAPRAPSDGRTNGGGQ